MKNCSISSVIRMSFAALLLVAACNVSNPKNLEPCLATKDINSKPCQSALLEPVVLLDQIEKRISIETAGIDLLFITQLVNSLPQSNRAIISEHIVKWITSVNPELANNSALILSMRPYDKYMETELFRMLESDFSDPFGGLWSYLADRKPTQRIIDLAIRKFSSSSGSARVAMLPIVLGGDRKKGIAIYIESLPSLTALERELLVRKIERHYSTDCLKLLKILSADPDSRVARVANDLIYKLSIGRGTR